MPGDYIKILTGEPTNLTDNCVSLFTDTPKSEMWKCLHCLYENKKRKIKKGDEGKENPEIEEIEDEDFIFCQSCGTYWINATIWRCLGCENIYQYPYGYGVPSCIGDKMVDVKYGPRIIRERCSAHRLPRQQVNTDSGQEGDDNKLKI